MDKHFILRPGIILPPGDRLQIHGRQLPPTQWIIPAGLKPGNLLIIRHREPVFAQHNTVLDQQPFENGGLM